jgi:hypothetical protein
MASFLGVNKTMQIVEAMPTTIADEPSLGSCDLPSLGVVCNHVVMLILRRNDLNRNGLRHFQYVGEGAGCLTLGASERHLSKVSRAVAALLG